MLWKREIWIKETVFLLHVTLDGKCRNCCGFQRTFDFFRSVAKSVRLFCIFKGKISLENSLFLTLCLKFSFLILEGVGWNPRWCFPVLSILFGNLFLLGFLFQPAFDVGTVSEWRVKLFAWDCQLRLEKQMGNTAEWVRSCRHQKISRSPHTQISEWVVFSELHSSSSIFTFSSRKPALFSRSGNSRNGWTNIIQKNVDDFNSMRVTTTASYESAAQTGTEYL